MTKAETEQRLAMAEEQLRELRVRVCTLDVLVQVLLARDEPAGADVDGIGRALQTIRQASPRSSSRPRLRLVSGEGSVGGQDLDEGLRRVRAARGEGR